MGHMNIKPDIWEIRVFGWSWVALALLVNTFTLGYFAADGEIRSPVYNAIILLFQIFCFAIGVYSIRRPRVDSLYNLGLALFAIMFSLIFMEQACRAMLFGIHAFSLRDMNSIMPLGNTNYVHRTTDPLMDYELKPNIDDHWCLVPVKTNSQGLRDIEYTPQKNANTFRIAVLGDSFSFPLGVLSEDGYPKLLEAHLKKDCPGKSIEVLNFAVPGYQLTHYLGQLKLKVLQYEPDLIIIGFCAENDYIITDGGFLQYIEERQKLPPFFTYYTAMLLKVLHYVPIPKMDKTPNEAEMDYMRSIFREMQTLCLPQKIPVVVAYLSHVPRPAPFLEILADETAVRSVNCSLDFDAKDLPHNSIYHPVDSHPNARANKIFFEKIYGYLKTSRLLPINPPPA